MGKKIQTDAGEMNVVVMGDKEDTIVLLPGFGTPSPYYDFRSLANALLDDYRIVIAEPFGYGISGTTLMPRTIENMNQELHQCLQALGIETYILAGHSIAGIYGLHYANTYPDEVIGYVGLDTSVACQIDEPDIPFGLFTFIKWSGIYRVASDFSPEALDMAGLSEEENAQRRIIMQMVVGNSSMKDEAARFKENLGKIQNMNFPKQMPVLFLLSSESVEQDDFWLPEHQKLTDAVAYGKTEVLEGGHYIHYNNEKEIADKIRLFFGENNEKKQ